MDVPGERLLDLKPPATNGEATSLREGAPCRFARQNKRRNIFSFGIENI
jgi:hypothetical protein